MLTHTLHATALKAKLFRGFSDPSRLSILEALRDGPLAVGAIVEKTGLSQSNVSNHLRCLSDCGLVVSTPQGRYMRVGDYAEHFTTERSRQAVKRLSALAPQTARVERDGTEGAVPIGDVKVGETVIVRPGESIPVDGEVIGGQATINQAALTGESMPVEAHVGDHVFAATIATLGSLRLNVTSVGADTTFGRVITMVEEAEAHRAPVQRIADRFSASFLPVVAAIALLTFLVSRNPLSVAAVLVVACSCSFALATPMAMLASIGAAASRGLLIKGGNQRVAHAHAAALHIRARAELLPQDKIRIVKAYQAEGHTVVMIGDGVNDAPALAQADVGIAMGVMGSDVALEAAHVALMREDWRLVPDLFVIAKRTMRVVKMNLSLTILYNLLGLWLAAFGLLPPMLAAAAQSLPDVGILANSSRLLRQKLPR